MKKILINLSLLMALSVSACDYYKNHQEPITEVNKCNSASMNSNCEPSIFDNARNEENEQNKKDNKPETLIAGSKNNL